MPVRLLNRFRHAALACLLGSLSLNAAADPVTLTLYNGQHAATGITIAKAFQDKTGIQVKIRKGGDGQLASQITEEGARSPADVLYTEESPPLIRLASRPAATATGSASPPAPGYWPTTRRRSTRRICRRA